MAKVAVYNMEGKEVDSIELNDSIFGVEINEHLVHMAVLQQLANNRQGTQKKTMETEGNRSCKTGIYTFSTVDRRRSCIRSGTKRLLIQAQQEREESCIKVCSDF